MPICKKCNLSIKPASLETTVAGESFHPTCIQCNTCDKPLWGKPFKRTKDGHLVCEQPCNPRMRTFTRDDAPPPASGPPTNQMRPPSAQKTQPQPEQKQLALALDQQFEQQMQFQNRAPPLDSYRKPFPDQQGYPGGQPQQQPPDLSMYKKPLQENFNNYNGYASNGAPPAPLPMPPSYYQNKFCKVCTQPVFNKRFITFENGEIICQECDIRVNMRPARVSSGEIF